MSIDPMIAGGKELRLIEIMANTLYDACIVAYPAPKVAGIYGRITHPVPGDLVVEVTTMWRSLYDGKRMGRFVKRVREPVCSLEQWRAEGGRPFEPVPTNDIWHLVLPGGERTTWENCRFITVLTGPIPSLGHGDYESDPTVVGVPADEKMESKNGEQVLAGPDIIIG